MSGRLRLMLKSCRSRLLHFCQFSKPIEIEQYRGDAYSEPIAMNLCPASYAANWQVVAQYCCSNLTSLGVPMRTEASVPPADRYLSLAAKLTEKRFIQEKEAVIAWSSENATRLGASNVAALELLQTLEPTSNLIAVVVVGCYADIPQGRIYTAAFHRQDGFEVQETFAKCRLGMFWSRIATEGLEHGHHQVAVLEFPQGVPPLLQRLPLSNGTQLHSVPDFGLCDIENWEAISAAKANT